MEGGGRRAAHEFARARFLVSGAAVPVAPPRALPLAFAFAVAAAAADAFDCDYALLLHQHVDCPTSMRSMLFSPARERVTGTLGAPQRVLYSCRPAHTKTP